MWIYVKVFYLINLVVSDLLLYYYENIGYFVDIIYFIDYVVEKGSLKYFVYVVSKVVFDNLIKLFVVKFVFVIKVNVIVLLLIIFNEDDSDEYKVKIL